MALSDLIEAIDPDVTERTVQRNLNTLRELSMVELTGHGRGARWMISDGT
jgi:phage anti-repressor protein